MDKAMHSIVILTWNGLEDTKQCVESAIRTIPEDFELIIVDNISRDKTVEWVKSLKPTGTLKAIKLIEEKCGFARACNLGIDAAESDYPIVCNNDVVFGEFWFMNLRYNMESFPDYAIIVPTTNYCGQPKQWFPTEDCIKPAIVDSEDVNFICFCVDKKFWKDHKLDENYISGVEDVDYCWQVFKANRRVGVNLASWIDHAGSKTNVREFKNAGINNNLKRGWEYFAAKWGDAGKERAKVFFDSEYDNIRGVLYPRRKD